LNARKKEQKMQVITYWYWMEAFVVTRFI